MAFGSPDTGNGTTVSFTTGTPLGSPLGDGYLISGIDFGEITRATLPFAGLSHIEERHHPGDLQTARSITFTGFLDVSDPEDEWPRILIESTGLLDAVSVMTLALPGGTPTYNQGGFATSVSGPNFVNNELLVATVVYQTDQQQAGRGWSAVA